MPTCQRHGHERWQAQHRLDQKARERATRAGIAATALTTRTFARRCPIVAPIANLNGLVKKDNGKQESHEDTPAAGDARELTTQDEHDDEEGHDRGVGDGARRRAPKLAYTT